MSPFLAWGDFHARSPFARSTISEEKWGTTRSLIKLWRRRASHLAGFTLWHNGCRATQLGRFTLLHNDRRATQLGKFTLWHNGRRTNRGLMHAPGVADFPKTVTNHAEQYAGLIQSKI